MWLVPQVVELVTTVHPERVLDVGPGRGKFGVLLREYVADLKRLDAVEAWPGYVTPRLKAIYDHVYQRDVCELTDAHLAEYDLVLMSEVIEHLQKDVGLALLDRIPGRVVVTTPAEFFYNGPNLPPTETHRSLWGVADFGNRVEEDASQLGGVVVRLAPRSREGTG